MLLDELSVPVSITPRMLVNIVAELSDLRKVRFDIIERLLDALSDGKATDNIEYIEAQEELTIVNSRIRELEHLLRQAEETVQGKENEAEVDNPDAPGNRQLLGHLS